MNQYSLSAWSRPTSSLAAVLLAGVVLSPADDWPTYRHDNARSGITAEKLATPLAEAWVYQSPHAPAPAWEPARTVPVEGILELPRVRFDDAFHVVSAGGAIFFGSTADNKVYCLDAATGRTRWTFFTGGPIRLAPTIADGRVYVGSDDGNVYCLAAADGKVVWQRQVGPGEHWLIGHGKMISLWPVRTGVMVDGGTAYYGAGLFPAEGVYVEAARADNGQVVWRNDTGGEATDSRISPQGYLLATSTNLFVPQGRVSPAAYDRKDGRRIYEAFFGKTIGGASALIAENTLYSGTEEILGYDAGSRQRIAWFEGRKVLITPETIYTVTDKQMIALNRQSYPKDSVLRLGLRDKKRALTESATLPKQDKRRLPPVIEQDRQNLAAIEEKLAALPAGDARRAALEKQRGELQDQLEDDETKLAAAEKKLADIDKQLELLNVQWEKANEDMKSSITWQLDCACPDALILAGDVLVAGGDNQVIAVDAKTGKQLW
ncbi:MAG: hypothetical protein FJ388_17075, partial [Verrucomicrobia bacterium]|nr:hypothetical protein [Verrucomicrobiota bacterium]